MSILFFYSEETNLPSSFYPGFATTPSKTPPSSLHERLELRESSLLRRSDANGISRDSQGERGSEHTPGVDERNCQGIERTDTSVCTCNLVYLLYFLDPFKACREGFVLRSLYLRFVRWLNALVGSASKLHV